MHDFQKVILQVVLIFLVNVVVRKLVAREVIVNVQDLGELGRRHVDHVELVPLLSDALRSVELKVVEGKLRYSVLVNLVVQLLRCLGTLKDGEL